MRYSGWLRATLLGTACAVGSAAAAAEVAAPPGGPVSLQEVVVTAQRRSERLQDVPFTVTALNPKALEAAGVRDSLDLPLVTPGLIIGGGGTAVQPAIRGISTTNTTSENNVSVYIDGVYQAIGRASIFDLADVSSIEVLKGPQGTLFGRNATGGAILINTFQPDLTAVKGRAYLSYGNFNSSVAKGFVSVPIIADKLAVSISGFYTHTDGWQHDLNQNGKRGARIWDAMFRGKVRYLPWEGADFTLTASYDRRKDYDSPNRTALGGNVLGKAFLPATVKVLATQPYTFAANKLSWEGRKDKEYTLHGDIELGPGKLSTTTAYHHNYGDNVIDFDYTNAPLGFTSAPLRNFYAEQEILYTTNQLGRFHAVGGVFLYALKQVGAFNLNDNGSQIIQPIDKTKSWAVFGEATYNLTDALSLTGGLRFTSENHRSWWTHEVGNVPLPPQQFIGGHTWHSVTPRVSVLYKLTPQTNLYGTFSKGFTSGTFNSSTGQTAPVAPETVTAFEAGIKSNEFSDITFSLSGFHYNYNNLQVNTQQFVGNILNIVLANAAKSKIYGAEFSGSWRVSDNFDLNTGGAYTHARFTHFPNAQLLIPSGFGGNATVFGDASGNHMIRSPDWTAFLMARYHMDTDEGAFELSGTASWSSKIYWDFANRLTQPQVTQVNMNASWTPAWNPKLKLSVWGKNLGDKAVEWNVSASSLGDFATYLPPRTYGLSVEYNY